MRNPFRHRCRLVPVGVQVNEGTPTPKTPFEAMGLTRSHGPVTFVLYRCPGCGQVADQTLAGHWTLGQIVGKDREEIADAIDSLTKVRV